MMIESLVFFALVAAYVLIGFVLLSTWLGGAEANKKMVPVKIRANRSGHKPGGF
jgi:hypothetical protein